MQPLRGPDRVTVINHVRALKAVNVAVAMQSRTSAVRVRPDIVLLEDGFAAHPTRRRKAIAFAVVRRLPPAFRRPGLPKLLLRKRVLRLLDARL